MKVLLWTGVNNLSVDEVPDPRIRNSGDAIVRVRRTVTCGSDLHLIGGYIPFMRAGDVLGHEFLGEIVEVGPGVRTHSPGDRVVVSSFISCGQCWYCRTDRPAAVREAIYHCRKGGSVFVLGVFAGVVDKFPLGAVMNKGLTLRGAQMHGQRYIPMLLGRMARGELVTEHLATHTMPLADGVEGYRIFKEKSDGCVRTVFIP